MNEKPYRFCPDVLYVVLPSQMSGLDLRNFESDWGTTDERLAYFEGTLIGKTVEPDDSSTVVVELLPKLDSKRKYAWPSKDQFEFAFLRLLELAETWSLRCERDADQFQVVRIPTSHGHAFAVVGGVFSYCAGLNSDCPNIHIGAV